MWGCFWMRLKFEWQAEESRLLFPVWVLHPVRWRPELNTRANPLVRKREFLLPDCLSWDFSLFLSLDSNWNISCVCVPSLLAFRLELLPLISGSQAFRPRLQLCHWLFWVSPNAKENVVQSCPLGMVISQQCLSCFKTIIGYPVIVFCFRAVAAATFDVGVSITSIPVNEPHFTICDCGLTVEIQ